jgi:hypothetical protein
MKESICKIQKQPVFSENFISDDSVRANGGVPTGVSFNNGTAVLNGNLGVNIYNPNLKLNGIYTVRIRLNSLNIINDTPRFFLDFRNPGTNVGSIFFDNASNTLSVSDGTRYVNSVATNIINAQTKEIVVSGITLKCTDVYIGSRYTLGNNITATYELLEIYEGTLTAQEVANLYNDKRYRAVQSTAKEILNVDGKNGNISNKYTDNAVSGINLVTDGSFTNWSGVFPNEVPTGWSLFGTPSATGYVTQSPTGVCRIVSTDGSASGVSKTIMTIGKTYRLSFDNIALTGIAEIQGLINQTFSTTQLPIGKVALTGVATSTQLTFKRGSNCNWAFDNVVVQEVAPAIINTAVTSVRQGSISAMDFNGVNSRLDCGNYDGLVGDKTFIAWVKPRSFSLAYGNRILDNFKLSIKVAIASVIDTAYIQLTSDAIVTASAAIDTLKAGRSYMVVCTRTDAGVTNIYINGVLSGTANQSSGTPVAGTGNLIIGNNGSGDRAWNGALSGLRILSGILSVAEINHLWSNERKLYNV